MVDWQSEFTEVNFVYYFITIFHLLVYDVLVLYCSIVVRNYLKLECKISFIDSILRIHKTFVGENVLDIFVVAAVILLLSKVV